MAADINTRISFVQRMIADPQCNRGELAVGVTLVLHFYNSDTGRCDPSIATIASKTGTLSRQVIRSIRRLEHLGYFRVQIGGGVASKFGATNAYQPVFSYPLTATPGGDNHANGFEAKNPLTTTTGDVMDGQNPLTTTPAKQVIEQVRGATPALFDAARISKPKKTPSRDKKLYKADHGCTIDNYQPDPESMGGWAAIDAPLVNGPVSQAVIDDIKDVWRKRGEKPKDFDATYRTYLRKRQQWAAQKKPNGSTPGDPLAGQRSRAAL